MAITSKPSKNVASLISSRGAHVHHVAGHALDAGDDLPACHRRCRLARWVAASPVAAPP
jgi:hypothetical protein